MNEKLKPYAGLAIIFVFMAVCFGYVGIRDKDKTPAPKKQWGMLLTAEYPVYSVTAPFGILVLEGNAVFLSGTDLDTEEVYIVKYLDGNILRTRRLNAEETGVVIDGTFKIVEFKMCEYITVNGRTQITMQLDYDDYNSRSYSVLHIPALPTPDMNMTSWYIGGN